MSDPEKEFMESEILEGFSNSRTFLSTLVAMPKTRNQATGLLQGLVDLFGHIYFTLCFVKRPLEDLGEGR